MLKATINAVFVTLGIGAFLPAASAGPANPRPPRPMILSATVDIETNEMIIYGRHFGTGQPTVRLAGRVLWVKSASDKRITADLPPGIAPATYSLSVTTNGPQRLTADPFSAALFAVAHR